METVRWLFDIFLHLDRHLNEIILQYHAWTYLILFVIVFCETGLVVTPFLPGDSLLFAAGTFTRATDSGQPPLQLAILVILLSLAAILGDTVNYWIGKIIGPKIFHKENVRFLNKRHLERAHRFYEKHGGKTIVIARFLPIIRTFAPFVAGIGRMSYPRFFIYNVLGGTLWVVTFTVGGFWFKNLIKGHFSIIIAAIVIISVIPAVVEYFRARRHPEESVKP